MIKRRIPAFPGVGLIVALLLPACASGSIILNFSLMNTSLSGVPGGPAVSFVGTLSAPISNTGTVFLNADSFNVDLPLSLNDAGFFNNAPLFLTPGQSFTGDLFDITIPGFAVPGTTYNGFFEIDGGADGGAGDPLASKTFSVVASPEPGTLLLLLVGSALLGCCRASARQSCEK